MDNKLLKEKLNRKKFRNQAEKLEKEKEKYPTLNGQFTENNSQKILDYFEFDEENANIFNDINNVSSISVDKHNNSINNEIQYELSPFVASREQLNIYSPKNIITKKKNINKIDDKNNDINNDINININNNINIDIKNDDNNCINNEAKKNQNIPKNNQKKLFRYFDVFNQKYKCHKCGRRGHKEKDCFLDLRICIYCGNYNHQKRKCPLKNYIDQKSIEKRKLSKEEKQNCLFYKYDIPLEDFNEEYLDTKKSNFYFKEGNISDNIEFIKKNKIVDNNYNLNDANEEEINKTLANYFENHLFCPKCGENHLYEDCDKNKYNNLIDHW